MTEAAPWCCLCGQRHPFQTPCDPARLAWLQRRSAEVASGFSAPQPTQKRETENT